MRQKRGFSNGEWLILLVAATAALTIGVPELVAHWKSDSASEQRMKVERVQYAKEQWALEHRKGAGTTVKKEDLVPAYLTEEEWNACAALSGFELNRVGSPVTANN